MLRALSHLALAVSAAIAIAGGPVAAVAAPAAALNAPPAVRAIQPLLKPFEVEIERALDEAANLADGMVLAHSGGLAKDGYHRHRAANERHWHKENSRTRGGPCVKFHGKTHKLRSHALCQAERIALARDRRPGWGVAWEAHAEALLGGLHRLPPPRK